MFLIIGILLSFITVPLGIAWLVMKLTIGKQASNAWLTAQFTTRELGGIPLDGDVRVFGSLHAAQQQLLSPMTQTPCIWHRIQIVENCQWQEEVTDQEGNTRTESRSDSRVVFERCSSEQLFIKDHLGAVIVMPDRMGLPGDCIYSTQSDERYTGPVEIIEEIADASTSNDWKSMLSTGLNIINAVESGDREYAHYQTVTSEYIIQDGTTVMMLAQVGQTQDNQRYLHASKGGRKPFSEKVDSAEEYQANADKKAGTTNKVRNAFAVFVALTAVSGLIGVVHDVPKMKHSAQQSKPAQSPTISQ